MSHSDKDGADVSGPGSSVPGTSNSDAGQSAVSPDLLRALASYADLPLAAGREEAVAAVLGAWLSDVNALSRKMSAPEHQDLAPATTFIHPSVEDGEA